MSKHPLDTRMILSKRFGFLTTVDENDPRAIPWRQGPAICFACGSLPLVESPLQPEYVIRAVVTPAPFDIPYCMLCDRPVRTPGLMGYLRWIVNCLKSLWRRPAFS